MYAIIEDKTREVRRHSRWSVINAEFACVAVVAIVGYIYYYIEFHYSFSI